MRLAKYVQSETAQRGRALPPVTTPAADHGQQGLERRKSRRPGSLAMAGGPQGSGLRPAGGQQRRAGSPGRCRPCAADPSGAHSTRGGSGAMAAAGRTLALKARSRVIGQRLGKPEVEKFNKEAEIIDYYRKKPQVLAQQMKDNEHRFRAK